MTDIAKLKDQFFEEINKTIDLELQHKHSDYDNPYKNCIYWEMLAVRLANITGGKDD